MLNFNVFSKWAAEDNIKYNHENPAEFLTPCCIIMSNDVQTYDILVYQQCNVEKSSCTVLFCDLITTSTVVIVSRDLLRFV